MFGIRVGCSLTPRRLSNHLTIYLTSLISPAQIESAKLHSHFLVTDQTELLVHLGASSNRAQLGANNVQCELGIWQLWLTYTLQENYFYIQPPNKSKLNKSIH